MSRRQRGFTLIELLVVIAIIGILAAISMPVVGRAMQSAKKAQASAEIKSIETAVKSYFNDYSKYPHQSGQQADYSYGPPPDGAVPNLQMMHVLRSMNEEGNKNFAMNPRKIVYLELAGRQLDGAGNFVDPWGSQYRITVDTAFDNDCRNVPVYGTVTNRSIVVWSCGPDKEAASKEDNITSW